MFSGRMPGLGTYTEVLQVIDSDLVAKEMDESILEHAAVTVSARWLVMIRDELLDQSNCGCDERNSADMVLEPIRLEMSSIQLMISRLWKNRQKIASRCSQLDNV